METMQVERSVWINASRERVWKAITEPDQVGQWFAPGTQWRSTGLEVGGKLSLVDPNTGDDAFTQVITVFDAPNELVTQDASEHPHTTRWMLKDENGGTRLLLIFSGYEFEPEDVRQHNMEENGTGFSAMLKNVKARVEGEALPYPQGF